MTPELFLRTQAVALHMLRYGVVFFLLLFGALKFFAFEAESIRPLMENSPLVSWMYSWFGFRGATALLGVIEIGIGSLIATRTWAPRTSGLASFAAAGMFVVTLSFLLSTPGVRAPTSLMGGFLMKDIMLLGASLFAGAEALLAALVSDGEADAKERT